ncbi:MAG: type II toxin-antitoxin system VapC family toxin [Synergistaceae bacterium]|jgi:predicted nucleic acid-binding protein|nr:type II toxin-antitoxin system VapC family toxin [Synergistaceae bacterium]
MKYFLDTNICIYFLNNRFPCLAERLASKKRGDIKIPVMTAAELAYGAKKSVNQEKTRSAVNKFLVPILQRLAGREVYKKAQVDSGVPPVARQSLFL